MLRLTLLFLVAQTIALTVGFVWRLDWIFVYLATVNLIAGPGTLLLSIRR